MSLVIVGGRIRIGVAQSRAGEASREAHAAVMLAAYSVTLSLRSLRREEADQRRARRRKAGKTLLAYYAGIVAHWRKTLDRGLARFEEAQRASAAADHGDECAAFHHRAHVWLTRSAA